MKFKIPYITGLKNALVCALVFLISTSFSPSRNIDGFKTVFQAFINDAALKNAGVGFSLTEISTGKNIFQHEPNRSLIPASTLKIITTAAALGILGEDFTFKTQLAYDTVTETIYIIGGGDPTLGSERIKGNLNYLDLLVKWQEIILDHPKTSGAKSVIAYHGRYENAMQPASWAWNDIGNYYGAGASGLSFLENTYAISLNAYANVGGDVYVADIEPKIEGLEIINELKTGTVNSGDQAYIFGAPYENKRFLRGTIPAGSRDFIIKGSMPNPALFCAQSLFNVLPKRVLPELKNASVTNTLADKNLIILHTVASPALKDIVYHTNLKSINLYAEHLVKECGHKVFNEGSTEAGIKAIIQYWKGKGLDVSSLFMSDGSGLSHYNAISASHLSQTLALISKEKYFNAFYNSLPVAGVNGAMKNMGDGTAISGSLRAKSGHMDRIRSYAGYASISRKYAFALIVNNYNCTSAEIKAKIEKLLIALPQ